MSASHSRIPAYENDPWKWFMQMRRLNLAFHTDDDPAELEDRNGNPTFTSYEVMQVNNVLRQIWSRWGDPINYAWQVAVDFGDISE